ncbi:hypothetical protein N24_0716 [Corynebacterium suranareeae]|uniref:Type VII secretion-associated protein n=1 Tax=Corynebacterium suranareeae TaxID=2506452 RepID=A0A169RQW4_9CORY|nr:type VII secretion-associated protein [Corynebacterium suranareeae]BAU94978.1 hypothetical protein N24_0716 [Corynebacterium suranareeae]
MSIETIAITVLETVTIFDGPETIYRYDLTAEGILDGWALPAVLDQTQQIAADNWPSVDVVVDATDAVVEALTTMFSSKGVKCSGVEIEVEKPPVEQAPKIDRPTSGKQVRHFYGIKPLHLVLVSVLVGSIAGVWLISGFMGPVDSPPVDKVVEIETEEASISNQPQPQPTVLVTEDLLIEAPFGFELRSDGQSRYLEGPDPNLRIHIGVDPLHGADAELVAEELRRLIADDPVLEEIPAGQWGEKTTIDYRETPGDGSNVLWVTWFGADRQFNVGCHSKAAETLVHKAQCRSVIEHLTLK